MQLIPFCLFTIICGYSLVLSAPVKQAVPDSQETKQQKATAIASRLLKEIAGEQEASHQPEPSSNHDESQDTAIPVNRPPVEKVESHIGGKNNGLHDDGDDEEEEIDFMPTLEDIFETYGDKYAQLADDEESSLEGSDDEYILPVSEQELLRYLADQEESDENLTPVIHTPVMDDSIMTAEDHQRRRRAI